MSGVGAYRRGGKLSSAGEIVLWSIAGLIVFAAHAGAVVMLLQEPETAAAEDAAPAAIMIELAPEPEAAIVEEQEITPDEVEAEEIKTAAIEPLPEPVMELPTEPPVIPPPPAVEPEPMPEPVAEEPPPEPLPPEPVPEEPEEVAEPEPLPLPPEEIDPIEEQMIAELENVEVPLPVTRPPPPPEPKKEPPKKVEKKKPEKKIVKKPTPPPPASEAKREAKAEVQQTNRTAAAQTSSGAGSSMTPAKWQSRLQTHLERRKMRNNGSDRGTPMVRFSIDNSGNVVSASIARSSGSATLDKLALDSIRRASPVPAPPAGAGKTITVPYRYL